MNKIKEVFSSFSVDDPEKAKKFYGDVLGLDIRDGKMGLVLHMVGGGVVFIYPKENHKPATFTVLNIGVADIDAAVDDLAKHKVELARYPGFDHDAKGIVRSKGPNQGPDIGWFEDPAGNVISLVQQ